MNKEAFFEILGEVDEQKIEALGNRISNNKRAHLPLIKWSAVAACVLLIITLTVLIIPKYIIHQPYNLTLSNGDKITFMKNSKINSSNDIALDNIRDLKEDEAIALFGNAQVNAFVGFKEGTNEFIYLEGNIDNYDIIVTRADISRDTVIEGRESKSKIEGTKVTFGYFTSKMGGEKLIIGYAFFEINNYTIYLETFRAKNDKKSIFTALGEEVLKLIKTSKFNFEQIK